MPLLALYVCVHCDGPEVGGCSLGQVSYACMCMATLLFAEGPQAANKTQSHTQASLHTSARNPASMCTTAAHVAPSARGCISLHNARVPDDASGTSMQVLVVHALTLPTSRATRHNSPRSPRTLRWSCLALHGTKSSSHTLTHPCWQGRRAQAGRSLAW